MNNELLKGVTGTNVLGDLSPVNKKANDLWRVVLESDRADGIASDNKIIRIPGDESSTVFTVKSGSTVAMAIISSEYEAQTRSWSTGSYQVRTGYSFGSGTNYTAYKNITEISGCDEGNFLESNKLSFGNLGIGNTGTGAYRVFHSVDTPTVITRCKIIARIEVLVKVKQSDITNLNADLFDIKSVKKIT